MRSARTDATPLTSCWACYTPAREVGGEERWRVALVALHARPVLRENTPQRAAPRATAVAVGALRSEPQRCAVLAHRANFSQGCRAVTASAAYLASFSLSRENKAATVAELVVCSRVWALRHVWRVLAQTLGAALHLMRRARSTACLAAAQAPSGAAGIASHALPVVTAKRVWSHACRSSHRRTWDASCALQESTQRGSRNRATSVRAASTRKAVARARRVAQDGA